MKIRSAFFIPLVFILACRLVAPPASYAGEPLTKGKQILPDIEFVRAIWAKCGKGGGDLVTAAREADLRTIAADSPVFAALEYVRCRILVGSGRNAEAKRRLLRLLEHRAFSPECLLGLVELNAEKQDDRLVFEECLAQLLPISNWRLQCDQRKSEINSDIDPPRPIVPMPDRVRLAMIGVLLGDAGLNDEAFNACLEAAYCGLTPSWLCEPMPSSAWISPDSADWWLRVAVSAKRAKRDSDAYCYLVKAAVFGKEEDFAKVQKMMDAWEDGHHDTPTDIPVEQKRKKLEQVTSLYVDINAHPRALAIIDSHPDMFGEAKALHKRISDQWGEVTRSLCRDAGRVMLFGTQIYPNGNPQALRIPWALTDDSMASARDALRQISARIDGTAPKE